MAEHTYVVEVPPVEGKPYNPKRAVSDLVKRQVLHLSLAERHLKPKDQTGLDVYSIKTEEEAARYVQHLTVKLHPQGRKRLRKKSEPQVRGEKSVRVRPKKGGS
jgi:hypothetical protein